MRQIFDKLKYPFTRLHLWQSVALISFFIMLIIRLNPLKQEKENVGVVLNGGELLPGACENFIVISGNLNNVVIVFLREIHIFNEILGQRTINPMTIACVYALSDFLPNFRNFDVYFEGARKSEMIGIKNHFTDDDALCKKAQRCESWESDAALESHLRLLSNYQIMLTTALIDEYFKEVNKKLVAFGISLKGHEKLTFLKTSSEQDTTLITFVNQISIPLFPSYKEQTKANTIGIIKFLIANYEENRELYNGFNEYLDSFFQTQRQTLAHNDCLTESTHFGLALCTLDRFKPKILAERDKSLAKHIEIARKNGRHSFFIAGAKHGGAFGKNELGDKVIVLKMKE